MFVGIRPTRLLQTGSEIHHSENLIPELDDEADHRQGDDHRYDSNHEVEEAGHERDDTIDDGADGCV